MSRNVAILCLFTSGLLFFIAGLGMALPALWEGETFSMSRHGSNRIVGWSSPMFYLTVMVLIVATAIGVALMRVAYLASKFPPKK